MHGVSRSGWLALTLLLAAVACDEDRDSKFTVDGATVGHGDTDASTPRNAAGGEGAVVPDGAADPVDSRIASDAAATSDGALSGRNFRVELRQGGAGVPGVTVLFHDAQGAVIAEHLTDANGAVVAPDAPSMITAWTAPVAERPFPYRSVLSYVGLEQGDQLVIALPESRPPEIVAHYDVSWDSATVSAMRVQVGGCNNGYVPLQAPVEAGRTGRVELTRACAERANAVLVTSAWDNDMGVHIEGFYYDRAPPPLHDGAASLQFTGSLRESQLVQVRSVPPAGWDFSASVTAFVGDTPYDLTAHTVPWSNPESNQRYAFPEGFADLFLISAWLQDSTDRSGGFSARRIVEERPPMPGDAVIDFAAALPLIDSVEVTQSGAGAGTVRWRTGDLRSADHGLVELRWPEASGGDLRWLFVIPAAAEQLSIPELPEPLRAAFAGEVRLSQLSFTDEESIAGYREFKSKTQLAWPLNYRAQTNGTWAPPLVSPRAELVGPQNMKETSWRSNLP